MSLTGDSINIATSPFLVAASGVIVGPGAEASGLGGAIEVDVADDSFEITYGFPAGFPVIYTLSDLDWVGDPNGFIVDVVASDGSGIIPTFTNDGAGGVSPSTINVIPIENQNPTLDPVRAISQLPLTMICREHCLIWYYYSTIIFSDNF